MIRKRSGNQESFKTSVIPTSLPTKMITQYYSYLAPLFLTVLADEVLDGGREPHEAQVVDQLDVLGVGHVRRLRRPRHEYVGPEGWQHESKVID